MSEYERSEEQAHEPSWLYRSPGATTPSLHGFKSEWLLIGDRFLILLDAAKRLSMHGSIFTISSRAYALRQLATAIARFAPTAETSQEWINSLEQSLRSNKSLAESSRWGIYNHASRIVREVARVREEPLGCRNPFTRRNVSLTPVPDSNALGALLSQARRDVLNIYNRRNSPDPTHVPFIEEMRDIADGGLFIPGDVKRPENAGSKAHALAMRWYQATRRPLSELTMHLYPSSDDLLPFVLLLSFMLAANPDSLTSLGRNPESFIHPNNGPTLKIALSKARAGEIEPFSLRDAGTLSGGWLFRAVLDMTSYLVPLAPNAHKNRAFLFATQRDGVKVLAGQRSRAMQRYCSLNGLPFVTLKDMRRARAVDDYDRHGNPYRTQKLLRHSNPGTTFEYLNSIVSVENDEIAIADAQKRVFAVQHSLKTHEKESAQLPSHLCLDPRDASKPKDENGLCVSYMWPFNDIHFIFLLEPKPVAYFLRDYYALCEAEKILPHERFQKLYAAKKRKMEDDYLPLIDDVLFAEASALIPSLPPAPPTGVL